ncbi:MAG: tetratricopeptide repeat protein, partial [Gemmatimonadota bacterium]
MGFSRRGRLAPDEHRLFALSLDEGEYVEVHLDPGPEDARIEGFAPGVEPGAEGSEATSEGEHAPETTGQVLWDLAAEPGVHHLQVAPAGEEPIEFRLEIQALRPATDQDRARERCLRELEAGDELRRSGHLDEALEQYGQAEAECEAVKYVSGVAALKARRSSVLRWIGQYDGALRHRESALLLRRRLGDTRNVFWNLINLADIETQIGEWEAAHRHLDESIRVTRELGDPSLEATSAFYRCALVNQEGPAARATEVCELAVDQLREVGPRHLLGPCVKFLAELEYSQGDLEAARELYLEAFDLARDVSDDTLRAAVYGSLAVLALAEGQFELALSRYQQSLELYRKLGNRGFAAEILAHMGDLHERLGNLESALSYFRQALGEVRELGQPRSQIQLLVEIGEILQQRDDLEGAHAYFEDALALSRKSGTYQELASSLQRLGVLHLTRGQPEKARKLLAEALAECRKGGDPWREAVVLAELARTHSALGQPEQGLELLERAVAINSRLGNQTRLAENHYWVARIERQREHRTAAMEALDRALAVANAVRPLVGGERLRSFFTARTRPYHELRIALLMDPQRSKTESAYVVEALRESERARARSLLEILGEANIEPLSGVSDELLAERAEIQNRLHAQEVERQNLLADNEPDRGDRGRLTPVNVEIDGLLTKLREIELRIRGESPDYAALTSTEPLTLEAIQQTVLDPETTLLEYWLGEEESFLWVVTHRELRSYRQPGRQEIEADASC